jgi:hypothetical protein
LFLGNDRLRLDFFYFFFCDWWKSVAVSGWRNHHPETGRDFLDFVVEVSVVVGVLVDEYCGTIIVGSWKGVAVVVVDMTTPTTGVFFFIHERSPAGVAAGLVVGFVVAGTAAAGVLLSWDGAGGCDPRTRPRLEDGSFVVVAVAAEVNGDEASPLVNFPGLTMVLGGIGSCENVISSSSSPRSRWSSRCIEGMATFLVRQAAFSTLFVVLVVVDDVGAIGGVLIIVVALILVLAVLVGSCGSGSCRRCQRSGGWSGSTRAGVVVRRECGCCLA